jgi:LmbE family N-acetylglucosaminyl deacetylase
MDWIYLSPHLDDVALSCGGLVWEQGQRGKAIAIWTICAGDPPGDAHSPFAESLHARWAAGPQAVVNRRSEDIVSCRRLGSIPRHFSIPDAIYRRSPSGGAPLYASDEALFGELNPEEDGLVAALRGKLQQALPPQVQLVCPFGIGGHVDHRLVRAAAESLNRRLWYYADYPYVVRSENRRGVVEGDLYQDPLLTNDALPAGQTLSFSRSPNVASRPG